MTQADPAVLRKLIDAARDYDDHNGKELGIKLDREYYEMAMLFAAELEHYRDVFHTIRPDVGGGWGGAMVRDAIARLEAFLGENDAG